MPLEHLLIIIATYVIPITFLLIMGTDILLRNHRNKEHILIACLSFTYLFMFLEELVRNLASIEYSPLLSSAWFSSMGLLTLSFTIHYVMYISKLTEKLPKWLNPSIFYAPLILVVFNLLSGAQLLSTQSFEKVGIWNAPIYNANYYFTLIGSIVTIFISLIPLFIVRNKGSAEQQSLYKTLIKMFIILAILDVVFGFIKFPDFIPPYPYLYVGIIFCFMLRQIMKKSDYLHNFDKRYEKLFFMNPDAIILLDSKLKVREINPVTQKFIEQHHIQLKDVYTLLAPTIQKKIRNAESIRDFEFVLKFDEVEYDLLLNIDQVIIEFEQHIILLIRDITAIKEQQREIKFLAYHDPLTKLPNRRYFFEELQNILANAYIEEDVIAIYLMDINNLKMLNDFRGHEAGDQSIMMLGTVLMELVEDFGIAARLGGDEFIVALNETKSGYHTDDFIQHVQTAFHEQVACFDNIPVGTSIGYSHYPSDSTSIDTLVSLADQSMYEMKKLKKVHYR